MASGNKKHWQQVLDAAERQGITISSTASRRGGHLRATREGFETIVHLPCTPSDYRGMQNAIADMRRWLGFEWKGR
jgi:hypothetical protein